MKTEKKTNKEFTLEKFEVAKLKNSHLVKGGEGGIRGTGEVYTDTKTSSNCLGGGKVSDLC